MDFNGWWVYPNIYIDLKLSISFLLDGCQDYCDGLYSDDEKADEMCDMVFGEVLSKYINDKNIKDIQLTKKEYHS